MKFYFEYLPQDILNNILKRIPAIVNITRSGVLDNSDVNYEQVFAITYPELYRPVKDIIDECFTMYVGKVDIKYYGYVKSGYSEIKRELLTPRDVITLNIDKWLYILEEIFPWRRDWISGTMKSASYVLSELLFYIRYPILYVLIKEDKHHSLDLYQKKVMFKDSKIEMTITGITFPFRKLLGIFGAPTAHEFLSTCYIFMKLDNWRDIVTYIANNFKFGDLTSGTFTDQILARQLIDFIIDQNLPINGWDLLYVAYQRDDIYLTNQLIDHRDQFLPNIADNLPHLRYRVTGIDQKRYPEIDKILRDRLGLNI